MSTAPRLVTTDPQKATHTKVDTIEISPDIVGRWKNPPFQRPLKVNDKVRALSDAIRRDEGVLPGVITIGVLERERYLLDGQHRREAFLLSGCANGYTDIRLHQFETMAEMGKEFVALNSQLVRLGPDDILRGLEGSTEPLARIRKKCSFVGYDNIRRGEKSPIVSMSALLRCWIGSGPDVPSLGGLSAMEIATTFAMEEAERVVDFLNLCFAAWGRDPEYYRLWGNLNVALCMWLYRRLVISRYSPKTPLITKDQFGKCLHALSADAAYNDYLLGRQLRERDRSPAYQRLKTIFVKRLEEETGKKTYLPSPAWSHSH